MITAVIETDNNINLYIVALLRVQI